MLPYRGGWRPGDGETVLEIEHRGWERFGEAAPIAATGTTGLARA